jgi:hypothetical protein
MKSMLKTMETTLAIMLNSPQKTMVIAIGVLFIGNYYNYIWIGSRFFQSFLSGKTMVMAT